MKKFDQGILINAEAGQEVRLLNGKLANYNQIWVITEKSENGLRLEKVENYGFESEYFFVIEAENMEIEVA